MHCAMLMTLYATGLRRAELCHFKVADIDSERMAVHVCQGKGARDHDVLPTPKLLETLREYWLWMKPKIHLFPGIVKNWRTDVPIMGKIVWDAAAQAAQHANITSDPFLRGYLRRVEPLLQPFRDWASDGQEPLLRGLALPCSKRHRNADQIIVHRQDAAVTERLQQRKNRVGV
jgi:hypothetical protein